jgi:hypothetical protein
VRIVGPDAVALRRQDRRKVIGVLGIDRAHRGSGSLPGRQNGLLGNDREIRLQQFHEPSGVLLLQARPPTEHRQVLGELLPEELRNEQVEMRQGDNPAGLPPRKVDIALYLFRAVTSKVSVYLDERTIERLRRRVVGQHGTLRSLSKEIEDLVRDSFVIDELEAALAEWGSGAVEVGHGFRDIEPLRLRRGPSLTEMVRREREHRHETSPRRQRRS